MAEDLHIFANPTAFQLFHDAGGGGQAIFRDPAGHGFGVEAIARLEVRDIYLHDGVVLSRQEWDFLHARRRHRFSSNIYRAIEVTG